MLKISSNWTSDVEVWLFSRHANNYTFSDEFLAKYEEFQQKYYDSLDS